MAETTMAALQQEYDNRGLVRKIQKAVAVLAPVDVDLPEAITGDNGAVLELPEGYLAVGLVTPDGYTFGREVEKADVSALGYASPVRSDITTVTRSITFTPLEHGRRHMKELALGVDLSTTTQAASGEVVFDEPDLPISAEYRLLVIGSDGPADNEWVLGRGYPRVKLANSAEEVWGGEDALSQELTLDVFTDDDLGTPIRHYLGGTGAQKAADILGYEAASGSGGGDEG